MKTYIITEQYIAKYSPWVASVGVSSRKENQVLFPKGTTVQGEFVAAHTKGNCPPMANCVAGPIKVAEHILVANPDFGSSKLNGYNGVPQKFAIPPKFLKEVNNANKYTTVNQSKTFKDYLTRENILIGVVAIGLVYTLLDYTDVI